ncbi:hypothetical protein [Streptomyces sp. 769]|uniref:hypothetical protein n=1 Tax=Streptomyces sp. 769 TaxID=1262452 RepID=UPI000690C94C|nr:hypothetical protein [Streptomyces sp. 769]
MRRFFTDPVRVLRAELVHGAYSEHRDWEHAECVWRGLASVQPDKVFTARSPERETAQERFTVYLPDGVPVECTDRIECGGKHFAVEGEPQPWRFGNLWHIKLKVWGVEN